MPEVGIVLTDDLPDIPEPSPTALAFTAQAKRLARRFTSKGLDYDDALQTAYLGICEQLARSETCPPDVSLEAWMYTAAARSPWDLLTQEWVAHGLSTRGAVRQGFLTNPVARQAPEPTPTHRVDYTWLSQHFFPSLRPPHLALIDYFLTTKNDFGWLLSYAEDTGATKQQVIALWGRLRKRAKRWALGRRHGAVAIQPALPPGDLPLPHALEIPPDLGVRIKQARQRLNLTQLQAAAQIGITKKIISALETRPDYSTCARLIILVQAVQWLAIVEPSTVEV